MMKRLEAEGLQADLSSVDRMLEQRSSTTDPVGWFQFTQRKAELEGRIAELQRRPDLAAAAVALYFGGRPVIESRGILAEFGARAVDDFQAIVSTCYAALEGPLGDRGPVPQRERSALMITEVARGSFGFVLEEREASDPAPQLPMTPLKDVVDKVCDLIHALGSETEGDEGLVDGDPEALDKRVLASLQNFFRLLDESKATLRVVEDRREYSLRPDMIAQARERTAAMNVEETTERVSGRLFLLPEGRRFELHPVDAGQTLKGAVSRDALASIVDDAGNVVAGLIGNIAVAELRVRELKFGQQPGRKSYQLLRIDRQIS